MTPSTPVPPDGSLVRGSSNANVYWMQSGHRRLVPDAATLHLLSAAAVQTLADADLAKIPEGPPLPSRAAGALWQGPPNLAGAPGPIYRIMGGARRLVPDAETLAILNVPVQAVQHVSAEDLAAVSASPDLPSFRDGMAYAGKDAYAYLIQGGHKRRVPDATSLRDLGHPAAALTISDADLALVPDGPAFRSTSPFLHPADSKVPLVLFPVRLETRFHSGELLLRIYPDTVHIDSFEPELTADESAARAAYLARAGTPAAQSAFSSLAQRFGAKRAAWIASAEAKPGTKSDTATRAPWTKVLPERWIVIGYLGDGPGQVIATTRPIPDTLAVGPAPKGPGPATDEGMRWLADFDLAVAAGMAVHIPLQPQWQGGFSRIVVVGLRTGVDPAASAASLAELLRAHHYTDGFELLPHAAPTNNTEDVKSALSTRDPGFETVHGLEQGPALCPSRPTSDGERLARALGLPSTLFAHVSGADGGQDERARAMQTVLWPATLRYYLEQMVAAALPAAQDILSQARSHFIQSVRARGNYPVMRIGHQPYGVLPVSWTAQWKPLEGRSLDAPLLGLLARLRGIWRSSVKNVPAIPGASDAEQQLSMLLTMNPCSSTISARRATGPQFATEYWREQQRPLTDEFWQIYTTKTLAGASDFAGTFANTLAAKISFADDSQDIADDLIGPLPPGGSQTPDYLRQLTAPNVTWQQLRDFKLPPQPVPLLALLLRYAALRSYLDAAADLLQQQNPPLIQPFERLEQEFVGLITAPEHTGPWKLLGIQLPGGAVGAILDAGHKNASLGAFAEFWSALDQLPSLPAAELDVCVREALDLASYRLDAWISSFAHRRLEDTRSQAPHGGIILGGYGWVEEVRPATATAAPPVAGGFVHAPSLGHATTAAILRSAFSSHRGAARGPFEIDLSSQRVRMALHLLDGIRQGQSLGPLLGYRLERMLHENNPPLDEHIKVLRQNFPLGSVSIPDGGAQESIPSQNVVDGLSLLQLYNRMPHDFQGWIPPQVEPQVKRLNDALDALADLTLAESVHQLSRGNRIRAGATLDAIIRGDAPPPDIDFAKTPRSGAALTHRLFAIGTAAAPGWAKTTRANAEPRLNGWAAALLGDPTRVRARGRFVDAAGATVGTVEVGIDQLNLSPLDVLAMPPSADPNTGELADRLRRAMNPSRPATAPTATLQIIAGRDPAWKADVVSVGEWLELVEAVARIIGDARALEPRDITLPDNTPGAIDNKDLQNRADAAQNSFQAAYHGLTAGANLEAALLGAAGFGVPGAVPALDPATWKAQADRVSVDLATRNERLAKLLGSGFDRTKAGSDEQRDFDVARLKAMFGNSFLALPALASDLSATWSSLWANSTALEGGDPFAVITWLQRAAHIRPGAERLDRALLYAEALGSSGIPHFDVAQLAATPGDGWLALPLAKDAPSGSISLVAHAPKSFTAGSAVAGLVLDEWTELIPSKQQTSGLAFQFDDPVARAPQTILVAVRPDDFPEWTSEAVEGTVLEALELAKLRAVDPDALETVGHYLPALYFAWNLGTDPQSPPTDQSTVDAVSINFTVAAPAPKAGPA